MSSNNDELVQNFGLHGKTALVTGASVGGIGFEIARSLAAAGAALVLTDHADAADPLREAVETLQAEGRSVVAAEADVTDEESISRLIHLANEAFGNINILAHTAGAMLRKATLDTTLAEWRKVLDVNLTGTFLLNREVARGMVERGFGRIVNTSTVYAQIVGPIPEPAYYASKAGVTNLTRGLAAEWGAHGVNVNCIAPGVFYPTRMTAPLDEQKREAMAERTLLKRLGDPQRDIGGTVTWLVSDAARYVTGQVIYIDGGWSSN